MSTRCITATPEAVAAAHAQRDRLRALAAAIHSAVRPVVRPGHSEHTAWCELRGVWPTDRETAAHMSVRVGDWRVNASVSLCGHDAEGAAREVVRVMRERIAARLAWHEAMARGCRAALAVVEEVSR